MKQIFLSGAMTGVPPELYHGWRDYITNQLRYDCRVFDPTQHSMDGEKEVMQYDLWGVRNSDVLVVNFDYEPKSVGVAMEVAEATHWGIPVIGQVSSLLVNKDLHPWLKLSCTKLFVTPAAAHEVYGYLDDMIYYLKSYYLN